jgi:hypothetical protein
MNKIDYSKLSEDDKKDLANRLTLAKKKKLWAVEILYNTEVASTGSHRIVNRTADEIMKIRTELFSAGVSVFIEPGHFRVIPPWRLLQVDLFVQDHYID